MRIDVSGSIHAPDHSRNVGAGPALITLLAVQIIIGYEWVASGITKIAFAGLIEVSEMIVGVAFMLAAIVWLARWSRLSDRWRMSLLWATMLSALGATFMAVNFHLAAGANRPWLIPADGFNETIDQLVKR